MTGDLELVALVIGASLVVSALIIGAALIIAAGRLRKRE